jgi:hypothetical protein
MKCIFCCKRVMKSIAGKLSDRYVLILGPGSVRHGGVICSVVKDQEWS